MLGPLGKITVIKTFFSVSIYTSSYNTSISIKRFLKNNKFNFLALFGKNKPDKIKHMYITQDYQDAGINMVNY